MNFFRHKHSDAEQQQELESYIDITAEEYMAQGMGADEARRAAHLKLGNFTRIREDVYEMNTATFFEGILRELRHAGRMLRLNPAFSLTAILTLALGIGATTAIFSVVNGIIIKPLNYPDSEQLVTVGVSAVFGNQRNDGFPLTPRTFAAYQDNSHAFQALGLWRSGQAAVSGSGDAEQVNTVEVTQETLPTLGIQPAVGRWFSPADHRQDTPETTILSSSYWHRKFGGDPSVIGRTITIDFKARQVIGVMPEKFTFQAQGSLVDVILPLRFNVAQPPGGFCCQAVARLKPGMTLTQANADVDHMLRIWERNENRASLNSLQLGPAVRPLKEGIVGDAGSVLWVLLGGIGIVLLIACANVANLLLVRAEGRGQELAVRTALGAGWGHIARGLMAESLTLGLAGGLLGVGLAYGGLRLLLAYGPTLPRQTEIAIDLPVLLFALATSLISGLLFGLVPVAKLAGPKFATHLPEFVRGGGRWSSAGKKQQRSQNVLVIVQVALALVLLVSSGLMIRTFQNLRNVQPGFKDASTLQTLRLNISVQQVPDSAGVTRMQAAILQKLSAIPGVTSTALVSSLPMEPFAINGIVSTEELVYGKSKLPPTRTIMLISPGYLGTLGTPILLGRDFTWQELYDERNVVLVSDGFARETWGSAAAAMGKRIKVGTDSPLQEVVGVVGDVRSEGVDKKAPATVYWPAREHPFVAGQVVARSVAFAIRSSRTGTDGFVQEIRQAVAGINSDAPLTFVRSMREVYDASMVRTSFTLVMLGIAGGMALLLGIVGIYGVLAYAVMQRRREVGIRLALGAARGTVQGMFVYRGLILAAVGIVLGSAVAAGVTRLMSSLLFGVTPIDAVTFAGAAGVLVIAALASSYLPARRAAAVDPVETLRGQ